MADCRCWVKMPALEGLPVRVYYATLCLSYWLQCSVSSSLGSIGGITDARGMKYQTLTMETKLSYSIFFLQRHDCCLVLSWVQLNKGCCFCFPFVQLIVIIASSKMKLLQISFAFILRVATKQCFCNFTDTNQRKHAGLRWLLHSRVLSAAAALST